MELDFLKNIDEYVVLEKLAELISIVNMCESKINSDVVDVDKHKDFINDIKQMKQTMNDIATDYKYREYVDALATANLIDSVAINNANQKISTLVLKHYGRFQMIATSLRHKCENI